MSAPAADSQRFSSRLGLILSVLGIAVGTGNIWRFPRIVAANGGEDGAGAFVVAWAVCLLTWSVPLIVAEYAMGRAGRKGVPGTFGQIAGPRFGWMGSFVAFVAAAIMFYYSVVAGWCFFYLGETLTSPLPFSTEAAFGVWDGFQGSLWPLALHALAMTLGALAVARGIKGIERVNKVLIPTLLGIVVVCVVNALRLPGALGGVAYLFTPDWSTLASASVWLEALTQNAWDTGAGWGLILSYAAYMHASDTVVRNAFITGVGNNLVSLLAATMIFATVFSLLGAQMSQADVLGVMQDSGPASTGLTFIWMPQLFGQMAGGKLFAIGFFLALSFAALSSLLSMIELATRVLVDAGLQRTRAVAVVGVVGFLLGVPSALSADILGNQDFVWGVGLMISGAFVAFAVIRYGVQRFRREHVNTPGDWRPGRAWDVLIGVAVPVQAVVLLVWWMAQATTAAFTAEWWNPLEPYSLMTCLVQWSVVLAILIAANKWLMRRTLPDLAA
jgi:NSS family neurotransmitter:Na+ symporter